MSKRFVSALVVAAALALSGCQLFKKCPGSASCPVAPPDNQFGQSR